MTRSFITASFALFVLVYNVAQADPIGYQGMLLDSLSQFGSVSSTGTFDNPDSAQYWTFSGVQGQVVTVEALRQEFDFDTGLWIFEGTFNDSSAFAGGDSPGFDFSDPGFLAFADDEISHPGPWGDPRAIVLLTLPGTGDYTAAVVNVLSGPNHGGDGQFDYGITAYNVVPEPSSVAIGLACAALFNGRFRRIRRSLSR